MSDSDREGEIYWSLFSGQVWTYCSEHMCVWLCLCVCVCVSVSLIHTQTAAKHIYELVLATLLERHILFRRHCGRRWRFREVGYRLEFCKFDSCDCLYRGNREEQIFCSGLRWKNKVSLTEGLLLWLSLCKYEKSLVVFCEAPALADINIDVE